MDLAALNAEVIIRCQENTVKKFELLAEIYNKQTTWAIGSDINKINDLLENGEINIQNKNWEKARINYELCFYLYQGKFLVGFEGHWVEKYRSYYLNFYWVV